MKLIGSLSSPYVRKARIVLAEKKIDYKLELENVWAADTTIHAANPLGKVPCLVMEDGAAVFDSRVICEYVDTLSPVGKLIPASGRERVEVRCWEALGDGVLDASVGIRIENVQRTPEQRSEAWIARQQRKIDDGLVAMSQGLGGKPWCAGNHYTLADVTLGCALGYLDFRMPELGWRERHPNLDKHTTRSCRSARPSSIRCRRTESRVGRLSARTPRRDQPAGRFFHACAPAPTLEASAGRGSIVGRVGGVADREGIAARHRPPGVVEREAELLAAEQRARLHILEQLRHQPDSCGAMRCTM